MVRVLSSGPYGKRAARTVPGGAGCSPSHRAHRPGARVGLCLLPQTDMVTFLTGAGREPLRRARRPREGGIMVWTATILAAMIVAMTALLTVRTARALESCISVCDNAYCTVPHEHCIESASAPGYGAIAYGR